MELQASDEESADSGSGARVRSQQLLWNQGCCISLVLFGAGGVVVVLVQIFSDKIPLPCKLPGDIHIKKENTEFSLPIATGWDQT